MRERLADSRTGRRTIAACMVGVARPRLTRAGLLPSSGAGAPGPDGSELQLYHLLQLLRQQGGDAYSRYNALWRELVSFASALDFRSRQLVKKPNAEKLEFGKVILTADGRR